MKIYCLGDSLTEGDYGVFGKRGIGDIRKENYPYFLSGILGAEVQNWGKCGYTASTYLQYYKDGNVTINDADYIIIMLGTNGGLHATDEVQGNMDYRELVELCRKDAPHAQIMLCTPPHATTNPYYSNCGYAPQVEQAVKFVRKYAVENKFHLIDLANCPDFTDETESVMQPNDGLHFGKIGYKTMARFIANEIKNVFLS